MKRTARVLAAGLILLMLGFGGAALGFLALRAYYEPKLPTVASLKEIKLGAPLRIYSADGKLIGEFGAERRIQLRYDEIPQRLVQAFLAAEDDRFFSHPGVDWMGLVRASVVLASTGEKRQGGSTITMQLARNVFLSSERTFNRKFEEIFLALKMERELSKQQILELYLNRIFLGNRAYGVGAAAQVYFGKDVHALTVGEMALLAGLPKAPSRDNPLASSRHARERRDYVLRRMRELHFIDDKTYDIALAEPVTASEHPPHVDLDAGYVAEMARQWMYDRYGENAYSAGYNVITTIDSHRQLAAQRALRDAIYSYDERHGYAGPEGHVPADVADELQQVAAGSGGATEGLDAVLQAQPAPADLVPAVVLAADGGRLQVLALDQGRLELPKSAFAWADLSARNGLHPGDLVHLRRDADGAWRLAHIPRVQAAFVALDPHDGGIQALVGGYDFYSGKYNRVTQAHRQVGSGFKPFLYSAALAQGYTPASVFLDAPIVVPHADGGDEWRPDNYEGKFGGPMSLRQALYESRNLVSIRLLRAVGIDNALDFIPRFGIPRSELPPNLTMALGTAALTPMEMARGYAVFANGGFLVDPYLVRSVRSEDGNEVYQAQPATACPACSDGATATADGHKAAPRVLDAGVDYMITSMMHDVVVRGTGARASELGRDDLAGKTGTTNDFTDAWFNGFDGALVGIAWVGYDQPDSLGHGEAGARAALPLWMDFMRVALKGLPSQTLPRPDTVVDVQVNPATGKLVTGNFSGAVTDLAEKDHLPPTDDGHLPGSGDSTLTDALY
jgi:penicillin-binding protein 1A